MKIYVSGNPAPDDVTVIEKTVNIDGISEYIDEWEGDVGFDSEATGRSFRKDRLVTMQLSIGDNLLVVDCQTINVTLLKSFLESHTLVIHNALNDLPFLYNLGIFPKSVWCTYLAEKVILGGGEGGLDLNSVSVKYGFPPINKEDKGRICYEVSDRSLSYCLADVENLVGIKAMQEGVAKDLRCKLGVLLENKFVLSLAYFSWCGVKIGQQKWEGFIEENKSNITASLDKLNDFVYDNFPKEKKLCNIDMQGDLFDGFKQTKTCFVKWNSEQQVSQILGLCSEAQSKELEKLLYECRKYKAFAEQYGKVYLSFMDENGRVHPRYNQLGLTTRVSCPNTMMSSKGFEMPAPSFMNLPKSGTCREAIIASDNYVLISADWSAHEVCIAAWLSGDKKMLEVVNLDNVHEGMFESACGKMANQDWYQKAYESRKDLNIAFLNGVTEYGIGKIIDENKDIGDIILAAYQNTFPKYVKYQMARSMQSRNKVIVFNADFGYRTIVKGFEKIQETSKWLEPKYIKTYYQARKTDPNSEFVRNIDQCKQQIASNTRLAISGSTQATGAAMFKMACSILFGKIKSNNLIGEIKFVIPQHDSITIESPSYMKEKCIRMLVESMDAACTKVCPGMPPIKIKVTTGKDYKHQELWKG